MTVKTTLCTALMLCVAGSALCADVLPDTTVLIREVEVQGAAVRGDVTSGTLSQSITAVEAERLGMSDISDAVRRMAGVTVKDYGGLGGMKTVSVRNMGAAHTAVAVDGVPVSNCQGGQIDLAQFSLWQTGNITLSVGHGDDLMQSARTLAAAATLQLTTRMPEWTDRRSWSLEARLRHGSWGEWMPSLRYGHRLTSRTTIMADAQLLRSAGDYPYSVTYAPDVTYYRANDDQLQGRGNIHLRTALRGDGYVSLTGHLSMQRQGLPGAVIRYRETSASERLWTRGGYLQALYEQRYNRQWKLRATGKYTYDWQRYRDVGRQYSTGSVENRYTQQELFVNATALWTPHRSWSVALAQDAAHTDLASTLALCPDPGRWTLGTALTVRYETSRWRLTTSATYSHVSEHVSEGEAHEDYNHVSPSAEFRYRIVQGRSLFLRAMYKNSYRVPTFNDLYYQRAVLSNLRPENAHQLSCGFSGDVRVGRCALQWTADGYWNRVTDKLVVIPTSYVWQVRNYGEASLAGIDLTAHLALTLSRGISVTLSGAYSWSRALDKTDEDGVTYNGQLPYTPLHSGSAGLLLQTPWVNVGWSMVAVGERWVLPENIDRNLVEGYTDHTVTLSHEFRLRTCSLDLQASMTNVGNRQYDIIRYYPMPSRAYHIQISLKL